jgi:hypothetical protein
MPWYKAGTVTVTNNSPNVIGAGTTWSNGAVASGAAFSLIDTSGAAIAPFYEVLSVTDDTHITLKTPYGGTTVNGAQYAFWNLAGEQTTPYLAAAVSELVRKCKNVEQNASTASSDAQRAETARSAAEIARDTAVAAKDVAVTAKTSAETSAQNAAVAETTALLGLSGATVFKGTLGTGGTITALPTADYLRGWTYRIVTAGTYAGVDYALGDLIIALSSFNTEFKNSDWIPVHIADEMNLKADVTYVDAELALKANIADVDDALALKAPLNSPTFTGDVVVPDQTAGNNSTKAANTKYVDAKVSDAIVNGVTGIAPSQNAVFDALALKADAGDVTASLALKADLTYVKYLMMEGDPA